MNGTYKAFDKISQTKSNGKGGIVINIASSAGITGKTNENFLPYTVSKTGLVSFTRGLGQESTYKKHGIKVFCVCPSFTNTDMIKDGDAISKRVMIAS